MLPSSYRLRREFFEEIFKRGAVFYGKDLSLFILKSQEKGLKHSLFSFSASKKVSKIAVERNKLRRRGYSSIQYLLSRVKPGFFCVFVYKPSAKKASFNDLREQIESLLNKSKILG